MITYDTLKELAQALSKVIGFRYIAFDKIGYDLNISFSNEKMEWFSIDSAHRDKFETEGYWDEHSNYFVLNCRQTPSIDWSKCQFDCKEADNEEES